MSSSRLTVTADGDVGLMQRTKIGFEWSASLSGFLAWSSGALLYLLRPPAGDDWRAGTWTWTRMDAAGTPPEDPFNGPYSKFQVDDAHRIALVCTARDGAVYAVRF